MKLHFLTHATHEQPGYILTWAMDQHYAISHSRLYANDQLPSLDSIDALVVLGGPMNVYETTRYPWLTQEKMFLRQAIDSGKPMLGICLGAQLLADVLGGSVTKNEFKEIGWHPVTLTDAGKASLVFAEFPSNITPLHWHGDTFAIPPGAVHLAYSEACSNQAFIYRDQVLGLQFHLEVDPPLLENFITADDGELTQLGPYIQNAQQLNNAATIQASLGWCDQLLTNFFTD